MKLIDWLLASRRRKEIGMSFDQREIIHALAKIKNRILYSHADGDWMSDDEAEQVEVLSALEAYFLSLGPVVVPREREERSMPTSTLPPGASPPSASRPDRASQRGE